MDGEFLKEIDVNSKSGVHKYREMSKAFYRPCMDSHDVSMAAYRTLRKPCRHVKKLLCKYILRKNIC